MKILLFVFLILFCFSSFVRCVCFNLHNVTFYSFYDFINYFISGKYKEFNEYGIKMFVGMFGAGKSLSMVHKARMLYNRYGDSICFISNMKLYDIPYVPLKNFNQLLTLGEDQEESYFSDSDIKEHLCPDYYYNDDDKIKKDYVKNFAYIPCYYDKVPFSDVPIELSEEEYYFQVENGSDSVYIDKNYVDIVDLSDDLLDSVQYEKRVIKPQYQGYVVLIDEIEAVLSHRNFANFPLQLLSVLCQQRKRKVLICCTAQRFFMVDKIFRGITTHVIDCKKVWRFQGMRYFDAWDYENAMNSQLLKPLSSYWWFVRNKDYNSYSTDQMITEDSCKDFISNDEKLARLGLDNVVNESAIKRPSRRLKRKERKK